MKYLVLFLLFINLEMMSQEKDAIPYYEIPENYTTYTAGTVAARTVDGLGFRFRWATEGLRTEDLGYKISEEGRTIDETLNHLMDLSYVILNFVIETPKWADKSVVLSIEEKQLIILQNLQKTSVILQKADDLNVFTLKMGKTDYPFWNNINGPIEDAVWHSGQIAVMRRAAGNPMRSGVSFMSGRVAE